MSDVTALPCAGCGYDLRVQPRDGVCPECETPVERAIEMAAVPVRPAWRDSDPRWRRRILAGLWVLALLPICGLWLRSKFAAGLTVPVGWYIGDLRLGETFFSWIYGLLLFALGTLFLFSKERGRRSGPFEWVRRWGVFACITTFLLSFYDYLLVVGLVLVGIGALLLGLPPQNQPPITDFLLWVGPGLIYFGPDGGNASYLAASVASSVTILLACVPLYDALRSTVSWKFSLVPLCPIGLAAGYQAARAGLCVVFPRSFDLMEQPFLFVDQYLFANGLNPSEQLFAFVRWLPLPLIALWLTLAQIASWRGARRSAGSAMIPSYAPGDRDC